MSAKWEPPLQSGMGPIDHFPDGVVRLYDPETGVIYAEGHDLAEAVENL